MKLPFHSEAQPAPGEWGGWGFDQMQQLLLSRVLADTKRRPLHFQVRVGWCVDALVAIVIWRRDGELMPVTLAEFERLVDIRILLDCLNRHIGEKGAAGQMVYKIQLYLVALPGYLSGEMSRATGHHQQMAFGVIAAARELFAERGLQ